MIEIFATDESGNRFQVTDLYWFEENGVHWFDGEGHFAAYEIEVLIDGKKVTL